MQTSRAPGVKYAPKWFERPVGATFGFGGRVVSFEPKKTAATVHVVPTDPDLVARADHFENYLANRDYRGFCQEKLSQAQDPHEKLSWELIELLFETDGRSKIVSKLGFNSQQIIAKAESYLGHPPGAFGDAQEQSEEPVKTNSPKPGNVGMAADLDLGAAEAFFDELMEKHESAQREAEEKERKQQEENSIVEADWTAGPEALIKESLLIE